MGLMLRLHLLAIAVGVGSPLWVHLELGDRIPPAELLVYDLVEGAFLAWWIVSVVWMRWRGHDDDTPDGWYEHTLWVFWFGNIATVVSFWIAMPYASESMRLMTALLCVSPAVIEVIGTVRTPTYGKRGLAGTLAPVAIPAGIVAWYLQSGDRYAAVLALFYPSFIVTLLWLREMVQNAVDAAYVAKQEAEAVRDSRTRFLASASHDLGQPLQAARLSFDQSLRAPTESLRTRAAGRVRWSLDAMEQQLRQMLDHLRLEARQLTPAIGDVAVGPLIARLAELNEPAARLAGVQVNAVESRLRVRGDPALIERAVGNFVANALRHAAARRVLIGARRRGDSVRIWVVDDGRGVPEPDQASLFEEYAQGGWRASEIRGGFGLGLASARGMARLMGGGAGHEPRWASGSAFWLELPRA